METDKKVDALYRQLVIHAFERVKNAEEELSQAKTSRQYIVNIIRDFDKEFKILCSWCHGRGEYFDPDHAPGNVQCFDCKGEGIS
jgi:hypothetical protein